MRALRRNHPRGLSGHSGWMESGQEATRSPLLLGPGISSRGGRRREGAVFPGERGSVAAKGPSLGAAGGSGASCQFPFVQSSFLPPPPRSRPGNPAGCH